MAQMHDDTQDVMGLRSLRQHSLRMTSTNFILNYSIGKINSVIVYSNGYRYNGLGTADYNGLCPGYNSTSSTADRPSKVPSVPLGAHTPLVGG